MKTIMVKCYGNVRLTSRFLVKPSAVSHGHIAIEDPVQNESTATSQFLRFCVHRDVSCHARKHRLIVFCHQLVPSLRVVPRNTNVVCESPHLSTGRARGTYSSSTDIAISLCCADTCRMKRSRMQDKCSSIKRMMYYKTAEQARPVA